MNHLKCKKDGLAFGGDGRADSPGHSAKYGSYTLLELSSSKVVDFQLVQVFVIHFPVLHACVHVVLQSNEVGGSYHMEKEGLHRCVEFVYEQGLTIDTLVTDRHKQINKWLRESHPEVKHYYDVWHVAKGMWFLRHYTCSFIPVDH